MLIFSQLTIVDLCVFLGILLLIFILWQARKVVGFLLVFLPFLASVLGIAATYIFYQACESVHWDTPGSPGILVLVILLGGSILFAISGVIALVIQIIRWRKPKTPQPPALLEKRNRVRVGITIACAVYICFVSYRYFRGHQDSHQATIAQICFSADGEYLYSIDRLGVLKKWNMQQIFEIMRRVIPNADNSAKIIVSGDDRKLIILRERQLNIWDISATPQKLFEADGVIAVEAYDKQNFLLLKENELSLLSYSDLVTPKLSKKLDSLALSLAKFSSDTVVLGFDGPKLEYYKVTDTSLVKTELNSQIILEINPKKIRVSPAGQYLVILDPKAKMAVFDLKQLTYTPVPDSLISEIFEISDQGQLLLARTSEVMGFNPANSTSYPLFSHGGNVNAIAISDKEDQLAIANNRNIYLRNDSRNYSAAETRLNAKLEFSDITRWFKALQKINVSK